MRRQARIRAAVLPARRRPEARSRGRLVQHGQAADARGPLRALGRLVEARAAFDRAASLGCREAVSGRGCLDLMLGDFERGWEGYEARWVDGKSIAQALGVRYPQWQGPQASPQRVLVI